MVADIGWQVSKERLSGVGRLEWARWCGSSPALRLYTGDCAKAGQPCTKSRMCCAVFRQDQLSAEGGRLRWRRPTATGSLTVGTY